MDNLTNKIDNMSMVQEPSNLESQYIDNIIQNMESVSIRPMSNVNSDASVAKMPIIPLEVVQYFATDYFDDEDFVYQEFVLPECVLDAIHEYQLSINGGESSMEPYHAQVVQYLVNRYMEAEVTDDNSPIFPILRRVIFLYESAVHYYTIVEENGPNCIDADSIYDYIQKGSNYEQILYSTAADIERLIQLNPESDEYQTIHRYSQETVYGLGLIIRQIKLILETYSEKLGINTIADGMHQNHIDRLFRLTNNMCVIMLFFFLVHEEALENCEPNDYDNNDTTMECGVGGGDVSHVGHFNPIGNMHINTENWKIGYRDTV